MNNRRTYPRIQIGQDVDLRLHDLNGESRLTGQVSARLLDLSRKGAELKFSQVLINGRHLFYTALDSETIVIEIAFRPTDDEPEELPPLLTRPVWLNRDMEDSATPFRMGVQFVDLIPLAVFSRFTHG